MRRFVASLMLCCLFVGHVVAVGAKRAAYIGGTHAEFTQRKNATEGTLDWSSNKALTFTAVGASIIVPYDRIIALEYQRAGNYRTTAGSGGSTTIIILPPFAVAALPFAARKKHFLTIAYKDAEANSQVIVLELGKEIEKEVRAMLAARSGKQINVVEGG